VPLQPAPGGNTGGPVITVMETLTNVRLSSGAVIGRAGRACGGGGWAAAGVFAAAGPALARPGPTG